MMNEPITPLLVKPEFMMYAQIATVFFIYSRTGAPSAHGISSTKSSNELITNKPIQPPATLLRRISSAPTITAAPAAIPLKGKQQTVAKLRSLGAVRVGYPNS